jgi:D-glycero-D-manno-heptose 1,7-bisphosphate phosphatase
MAVFVDIYGTLVEDRPPRPSTVDEIRVIPWVPGAIDALRRFESIGYQPHVILNDEKVHGQFVDLFTLSDMHLALYYRAKALGARLTSFKTCQHEAHEGCVCRAPRPGLLQQIAKRYMLNLSNCIVVSKDPAVVQSGFVAGCRSYLLDTWDTLDLDHPVTAMEAIE